MLLTLRHPINPSFWDITKNMMFPDAGNTPAQDPEKKTPQPNPGKPDEKKAAVTYRNAALAHDVT